DGTDRPVTVRQTVRREWVAAPVFQPSNAVLRPQQERGIKGITVAQQYVDVAVAVQVDELHAVTAVRRVWGGPYRVAAEPPAALIHKSDDGLVLLGDNGHEVGLPVGVQVGHRHVRGTVPLLA